METCKDCGMPLENKQDKCSCEDSVCVHCCKCEESCSCGCEDK